MTSARGKTIPESSRRSDCSPALREDIRDPRPQTVDFLKHVARHLAEWRARVLGSEQPSGSDLHIRQHTVLAMKAPLRSCPPRPSANGDIVPRGRHSPTSSSAPFKMRRRPRRRISQQYLQHRSDGDMRANQCESVLQQPIRRGGAIKPAVAAQTRWHRPSDRRLSAALCARVWHDKCHTMECLRPPLSREGVEEPETMKKLRTGVYSQLEIHTSGAPPEEGSRRRWISYSVGYSTEY